MRPVKRFSAQVGRHKGDSPHRWPAEWRSLGLASALIVWRLILANVCVPISAVKSSGHLSVNRTTAVVEPLCPGGLVPSSAPVVCQLTAMFA